MIKDTDLRQPSGFDSEYERHEYSVKMFEEVATQFILQRSPDPKYKYLTLCKISELSDNGLDNYFFKIAKKFLMILKLYKNLEKKELNIDRMGAFASLYEAMIIDQFKELDHKIPWMIQLCLERNFTKAFEVFESIRLGELEA
jgi:hypothetical protein